MMGKHLFLLVFGIMVVHSSIAQTTYLPFGSDEYHLLNRLETRSGYLSSDLFLNTQPVSRKDAARFLREEKSDFYQAGWTNIDQYNINRALSISGEWADANGDGAADSKYPVLNTFYKKQTDFLYLNKNDFSLRSTPC